MGAKTNLLILYDLSIALQPQPINAHLYSSDLARIFAIRWARPRPANPFHHSAGECARPARTASPTPRATKAWSGRPPFPSRPRTRPPQTTHSCSTESSRPTAPIPSRSSWTDGRSGWGPFAGSGRRDSFRRSTRREKSCASEPPKTLLSPASMMSSLRSGQSPHVSMVGGAESSASVD